MGFWEHLDELRGTLVKSLIAFIVCAVLVGTFYKRFHGALLWPLQTANQTEPDIKVVLITTSPLEVFNVLIQLCVFGGLALAAPFIMFFIAQFVSPALTQRETRVVVPLCASAFVLFLIGAGFAFFLIMPGTLSFAGWLNTDLDYRPQWTAGNYFSMLTWVVVGTGAVFEFPLVQVLLVWIGVISTAFLRKYRRHVIIVIFIVAAIITPTPDPIMQCFVAAPLYVLFEIAILISARIEKKRAEKPAV